MKFFLETKLAMKKKWKILKKNIICKTRMHFFVFPMLPTKHLQKFFCSLFKNKKLKRWHNRSTEMEASH